MGYKEFYGKSLLKMYDDYTPDKQWFEDNTGRVEDGGFFMYFDEYKASWTPSYREAVMGKVFSDLKNLDR